MRRVCPKCGSTSVITFDADEDYCTSCSSRLPGLSIPPDNHKIIEGLTNELATLRSDLASVKRELAEAREEVDRLKKELVYTASRLDQCRTDRDVAEVKADSARAAGMAEMREMAKDVVKHRAIVMHNTPSLAPFVRNWIQDHLSEVISDIRALTTEPHPTVQEGEPS